MREDELLILQVSNGNIGAETFARRLMAASQLAF